MVEERKNIIQKNKVLKAAKQDAEGYTRRRQISCLLYGPTGGPTISIAGDKPKHHNRGMIPEVLSSATEEQEVELRLASFKHSHLVQKRAQSKSLISLHSQITWTEGPQIHTRK